MTPVTHESSTGGHSNAPTTASEPRGSFTTARRKSSCLSLKRSSRAESGPLPRSGAPLITTRVGSPPVCESITFIRRTGILSHKKARKHKMTLCSKGRRHFSLCRLCVLSVSVVDEFPARTHHGDTENGFASKVRIRGWMRSVPKRGGGGG